VLAANGETLLGAEKLKARKLLENMQHTPVHGSLCWEMSFRKGILFTGTQTNPTFNLFLQSCLKPRLVEKHNGLHILSIEWQFCTLFCDNNDFLF